MSQRNKFIILGALVVLMGILAYHQLAPSNSQERKETAAPPPAQSAPATTSAPAGAGAEVNPAGSAQDSEPSSADLRELAGWFDLLRPAGAVIAKDGAPVFGIALKTELPMPDVPPQEPSQMPWKTKPGKLDGIIKVGDAPGQALFQGKLYKIGERVRGTTFILVAVDEDFVTLKSDDRVIRRFWHD